MRRLAAIAALAVMLTGCSSADFGPIPVYKPRFHHYETNGFVGALRISDECVTVDRDGETTVFLFPTNDVEWDAKTSTVTYLGKQYKDGDFIYLPAIINFGRKYGDVPEGCPSVWRVYVLSSDAPS